MTDNAQRTLSESLRGQPVGNHRDLGTQAADTIESLQAEVEKVRQELAAFDRYDDGSRGTAFRCIKAIRETLS